MWNKSRSTPLLLACLLVGTTPAVTSAQLPIPLPIPGLGGGPLIVFDPAAVGKLVDQIRSQLEQVAMQRRQLEEQLVAMRKLRDPNWREIADLLVRLEVLMQQDQALAYSLQAIDAEFRQTFPGVQVFEDFRHEEAVQATRTLATIRGVLNAASHAGQAVPQGLARLSAIKQQLAAIRGHEEALELNATIGVYSAEEMVLLRQAIAAQTNMQAVYFADQVNAAAQERATFRANLDALASPAPVPTPYSLQVVP